MRRSTTRCGPATTRRATASFEGRRALRRGLLTLGLLVLGAGAASAQMVFDGNVVFNNNATGTFAGQFSGLPTPDSTTCLLGTSAAQLGTVTYTHNVYGDPLLPTAPYKQDVIPNFRPAVGSPAWGRSVVVPNDG